MQNLSVISAGGYTSTPTDGQGRVTGNPAYSVTGSKQTTVSSSAILKGDFKNPLPFSYDVVTGDAYFRGKVLRLNNSWYPGDGAIIEGNYGGFLSLNAAFKEGATDPYNKCLSKLYDQIRAGVDLSVDLYQVNQTVALAKKFVHAFGSPLRTFTEVATSLLKKKKFRRGTGQLADSYLEWKYGLMPSMSTMYELTDELIGGVMKDGFYVVKARASSTWDGSGLVVKAPNLAFGSMPIRYENLTDSRRCEIALSYSIDNVMANSLSQFTSLNPVSFIYENIMFSFVWDWLVNIGGYLRNLETALFSGLVLHSGYISTSRLQTVGLKALPATVSGTRWIPTLQASLERKRFNRSILIAMPKPQLPSIEVNLGTSRLFSAAALLRSFLH